MDVSNARKLKALDAENDQLKKLFAEHVIDVSTLKKMSGKTFEARITTQFCGLGYEREAIQSEARLRVSMARSACLSPGIQATSGY